jgi:beta-lactamase superfamily II metal-dependent hydrolase
MGVEMGYEIDFLAVGEESKGGDAITLRYGNLFGSRSEQVVVVVDGGYMDSGEALVKHVAEYYGTSRADFVVSTHPDIDHINGLKVVLEEMEVGTLLMHQPWNHSGSVAEAKKSAFRSKGYAERVEKSFDAASELEAIANRKGVKIVEPFCGVKNSDGVLRILGPTREYYESLITTEVEAPPEAKAEETGLQALVRKALGLIERTAETLDIETLRDDGETTPTNNSSAICLLTIDGKKLLLTGDAGIPALERAMSVLEAEGFQPGGFRFVQVPHHGSRRNVGPSILDRMLGPKGTSEQQASASVSVPKKNPEFKFPAKKVTNAFRRRGYYVHATAGEGKYHHSNSPDREGWTTSTPLPFYTEVEEDSGT